MLGILQKSILAALETIPGPCLQLPSCSTVHAMYIITLSAQLQDAGQNCNKDKQSNWLFASDLQTSVCREGHLKIIFSVQQCKLLVAACPPSAFQVDLHVHFRLQDSPSLKFKNYKTATACCSENWKSTYMQPGVMACNWQMSFYNESAKPARGKAARAKQDLKVSLSVQIGQELQRCLAKEQSPHDSFLPCAEGTDATPAVPNRGRKMSRLVTPSHTFLHFLAFPFLCLITVLCNQARSAKLVMKQ